MLETYRSKAQGKYSMKYAIDLDGVCFDFLNAFREQLNSSLGINLKEEDITDYYWYENSDEFDEEDFFTEFHSFGMRGGYKDLDVIDGTIEALQKILDAGHELCYITARPNYAFEDTIRALDKHDFPSKERLFFVDSSKALLMNELGIDVAIDDSPDILQDLKDHTNVHVYCKNYKYNEKLECDLVRVNSWKEFLSEEGL